MERNSVADLIVSLEEVAIPEEVLAEIARKSKIDDYAVVDINRVAKMPVRGRYIFMVLCILSKVQFTTKKSVKREMRPWFFVKTAFWKERGIPENTWYRALNNLVTCGIIKKKAGAGPSGRNLYAFTDMLQQGDKRNG